MGWWKLLTNLNNADGIREAMRMSFDKGLAASNGQTMGGLYQALASRWLVRGVPMNSLTETLIWGELVPFLHLPQIHARNAIVEYVVYKERPADADIDWLTKTVQYGCSLSQREMASDEYQGAVLFARTVTGQVKSGQRWAG